MTKQKVPTADPGIVIGYTRASTGKQELGPQAQRAALEDWCREHKANLVAVHEDRGVSGGTPIDDRPGLLAALNSLRARGAGVLLVARRDRLARDPLVALMAERLAERSGATVCSADGQGNGHGPEGELMRRVLDAVAQFERSLIRLRIRSALAVKRSRGEKLGGRVPYGYRLGRDKRRLEPYMPEQKVIDRATALRAAGMPLRSVARALEAEGHTPRSGRQWHQQAILRITTARA